jgi:hypothetical protein
VFAALVGGTNNQLEKEGDMHPNLIKAAQELAKISGKTFDEILSLLQPNWTSLTGHPVYVTVPSDSQPDCGTFPTESIEDLVG